MKVVIVGGVAGGAGAAARLRRNNESAQIVLFEKGEYISFANCGLPYYVGGAITDKAALQLQTPASFHARFNVDVRVQSEVVKVDPREKTVLVKNHANGTEYTESYDKLILSPGAAPIRPAMEGADGEQVFTLRNIPDTYRIKEYVEQRRPKTCAVIGGGFIGVEMAENLKEAGLDVTIVEAQDHLFANIDTDMSYDIHGHLRAKGVKLCLGHMLESIRPDGVMVSGGAFIPAEMVLLSIGVRPETAFLADSGIELGKRGEILVDEYMQTNEPDVYAVGDAISVENFVTGEHVVIPLAGPANKQARIVADNVCGKREAYNGSQGTAVAKVFDMTVASTGLTEAQVQKLGLPYHKTFTFSQSHASYYPGGKPLFLKLIYSPEGEILGAQITGYDGVDKRIDVIATAQRAGLTVWDLAELELSYAPPYSSAKDPVNMAGFVACNVLEGRTDPFFVEDLSTLSEDALWLDIRTGGEYERGTIPGFVNIPLDDIRQSLDRIPKEKELYITCQVGLRGYVGERILKNLGYKVHNLSGGYRHYAAFKADQEARAHESVSRAECGMED